VSLEVAEHLPEESADAFVAFLTTLAPVSSFPRPSLVRVGRTTSMNSGPSIGPHDSRNADTGRSITSATVSGTVPTWNGGTRRTFSFFRVHTSPRPRVGCCR
jgi:hypothetical protein